MRPLVSHDQQSSQWPAQLHKEPVSKLLKHGNSLCKHSQAKRNVSWRRYNSMQFAQIIPYRLFRPLEDSILISCGARGNNRPNSPTNQCFNVTGITWHHLRAPGQWDRMLCDLVWPHFLKSTAFKESPCPPDPLQQSCCSLGCRSPPRPRGRCSGISWLEWLALFEPAGGILPVDLW